MNYKLLLNYIIIILIINEIKLQIINYKIKLHINALIKIRKEKRRRITEEVLEGLS